MVCISSTGSCETFSRSRYDDSDLMAGEGLGILGGGGGGEGPFGKLCGEGGAVVAFAVVVWLVPASRGPVAPGTTAFFLRVSMRSL